MNSCSKPSCGQLQCRQLQTTWTRLQQLHQFETALTVSTICIPHWGLILVMPILEQFSSDVISGCKKADKQQGNDLEDGLCASFFCSVSFMSGSPLLWKDLKAQHAELKKVLQVG